MNSPRSETGQSQQNVFLDPIHSDATRRSAFVLMMSVDIRETDESRSFQQRINVHTITRRLMAESSAGDCGWTLLIARGLALLAVLGVWSARGSAEEVAPRLRPNVILIMADDFGYECVTANGGESYRTPNLDRLAAEGVRFTQCHVQPLCTPTRVQLMTGFHNVRNYLNFGTLPRTEKTFATHFQKAGYRTGIAGKWQLGREVDAPQHFGFEEACLWQHTRRPPRYANPGLEHQGVEKNFTQGEYGPDLIQKFAFEFIERHRSVPFCLYYPMVLTHDPFQPTPDSPDWDPQARGENVHRHPKHFAEMVAYLDKHIGQLDDQLTRLQLRERTLVLFLGDNGTSPAITSRFRGRAFQGGKGSTTHRGTHVPLIASWPGTAGKGRVCDDLISSVDVFSTLCAAAGITVPATDGVSFLPQIQGQPGTPREALYAWYSPRQKADLTVREFAFDQEFKLYRDGRMFDLRADPEEQQVLAEPLSTARARTAKERLSGVLKAFDGTRPAALDQQFRQAKSLDNE